MHLKDFAKSGNPKTLFSAFFYFDISFMIWVMLGPLGNSIAEQFSLSASQQGLVLGIAGAGNSGTVLASLFAPRLAAVVGSWQPVLLLATIPVAVAWLV